MKKIYILFLVFILVFSIYPCRSNALGGMVGQADNFTKSGESPLDEQDLVDVSNDLYNIFLAVGILLAVIIAMVLGIQFMTGSIETQAKVKESLIPFVIGCVVIFGGFGIWKIVVSIGNNLLK